MKKKFFHLSVDEKLYQKVKEAAKKDYRTVVGYITKVLSEAIEKGEK